VSGRKTGSDFWLDTLKACRRPSNLVRIKEPKALRVAEYSDRALLGAQLERVVQSPSYRPKGDSRFASLNAPVAITRQMFRYNLFSKERCTLQKLARQVTQIVLLMSQRAAS
jgi:hypothetical protein